MRSESPIPAARHPRPMRLVVSSGQHGFSLIVALMMLIVIIILGISASQMTINEERGARNDRDRQLAFQAAEAAIKDAEFEIYGPSSPLCDVRDQADNFTRKRSGTNTCFNSTSQTGFAVGCSGLPNAGLCAINPLGTPAYLDSANVDFYKDATGSGNNHTVAYGTYTNRAFPSQLTLGPDKAVSAYPPRYIIETVHKNTGIQSVSSGPNMFRVTAMGFGANPNSQVVLQVVIATQY